MVHGLLNGDLDPQQLWALTHHSPDVIMVLDLQQRIEFINRTAPGLTIEGVLMQVGLHPGGKDGPNGEVLSDYPGGQTWSVQNHCVTGT